MHRQFQFCPRCKKKITDIHNRYVLCTSCSFWFYFNPAPCVATIVTNPQKSILLVERAHAPKKGYWDLPGGFMEQGESTEEALRREIAEELGVLLRRTKYQGSYPDRYRFKNIHYHTITSVFTGALSLTAKLVPADDVAGFRWFDRAHLPWDRVGFPSLQQALKEYCAL